MLNRNATKIGKHDSSSSKLPEDKHDLGSESDSDDQIKSTRKQHFDAKRPQYSKWDRD